MRHQEIILAPSQFNLAFWVTRITPPAKPPTTPSSTFGQHLYPPANLRHGLAVLFRDLAELVSQDALVPQRRIFASRSHLADLEQHHIRIAVVILQQGSDDLGLTASVESIELRAERIEERYVFTDGLE